MVDGRNQKKVEARESAGCRNWNGRVLLPEGSGTGAGFLEIAKGEFQVPSAGRGRWFFDILKRLQVG
jgi:hypothetical protein